MTPSETRKGKAPKRPDIARVVAARGRRPMVMTVFPADQRPVHGVVFAEDDRFIQHQDPMITTRG